MQLLRPLPLFASLSVASADLQVSKRLIRPLMRVQPHSARLMGMSLAEGNVLPLVGRAENHLMLVDGKSLLYRAYYRVCAKIHYGSLKMPKTDSPDNSSWDSIKTTVVAMGEILKLLELRPSHAAVVFDFPALLASLGGFPGFASPSSGGYWSTWTDQCGHSIEGEDIRELVWATFRHQLYPAYKSNRLATPDAVRQAISDIKCALLGMGVEVLEIPGVEADDVIGTLSKQAVQEGMKVRIISADQDFFQLLSPQLRLLRFRPKGSGFDSFGVEEFQDKFGGLEVDQYVDMRALTGDRADNIAGVRGIGETAAIKLIRQFGSLEKILEEQDTILDTRVRSRLSSNSVDALLNKKLLLLRLDIPAFALECTLDGLICCKPKDGGRAYTRLLDAFSAIVGQVDGTDLLERTSEYWRKL